MPKVEDFREQKLQLDGWPVNVTSYQLGEKFFAKADNVSPGAALARASALTRDEAESAVIERARKLLARTRRVAV
jgi:hypothetical protein